MKTKAKILVVEDNAFIYKRLKIALVNENYEVDSFTPSVKNALKKINTNQPDVVLLDIDLKGIETGLDLGKLLSSQYNIPFIYVTDFDDDQTFFEGLSTKHHQFIVKTKPQLDSKEVIRAIQTVLSNTKTKDVFFKKEGIIGLVNYLDEVKKFGFDSISKTPVKFEKIAFFSAKPFINNIGKEESLRSNYLYFVTKDKERYFIKKSLKVLQSCLPYYFVRINESYIVNISSDILQGRINGVHLSLLDQKFMINDTYKKEFNKRFEALYEK